MIYKLKTARSIMDIVAPVLVTSCPRLVLEAANTSAASRRRFLCMCTKRSANAALTIATRLRFDRRATVARPSDIRATFVRLPFDAQKSRGSQKHDRAVLLTSARLLCVEWQPYESSTDVGRSRDSCSTVESQSRRVVLYTQHNRCIKCRIVCVYACVCDSVFVESTHSKADAPQPHEILVKSQPVSYTTDAVATLRVHSTDIGKVIRSLTMHI